MSFMRHVINYEDSFPYLYETLITMKLKFTGVIDLSKVTEIVIDTTILDEKAIEFNKYQVDFKNVADIEYKNVITEFMESFTMSLNAIETVNNDIIIKSTDDIIARVDKITNLAKKFFDYFNLTTRNIYKSSGGYNQIPPLKNKYYIYKKFSKDVYITAFSFNMEGYKLNDSFSIYIQSLDRYIFENIYFKEFAERKVLNSKSLIKIPNDTNVLIIINNNSGNYHRLWYNLEYIEQVVSDE